MELLRIYTFGAESTTRSVPVAACDTAGKLLLPPWKNIVGLISLCAVFGPGVGDKHIIKPQLNSTFCKETQLAFKYSLP